MLTAIIIVIKTSNYRLNEPSLSTSIYGNYNWLQVPLKVGIVLRPKNGVYLKVIERSQL